jgi:hypothetical protein
MSDAVAIVAVASSGVVGVAGVASGVYGAARERRWRGREERVAELRTVLDDAAQAITAAMQALANAHLAIAVPAPIDRTPAKVANEQIARAHELLDASGAAQRGLWAIANRVRLRTGPNSEVARALGETEHAVGLLGAFVKREVADAAHASDYGDAWRTAHGAQEAFYAASARELWNS